MFLVSFRIKINGFNKNFKSREKRDLRDDIKKKRVKNRTLAQKVGRYQNQIPI